MWAYESSFSYIRNEAVVNGGGIGAQFLLFVVVTPYLLSGVDYYCRIAMYLLAMMGTK